MVFIMTQSNTNKRQSEQCNLCLEEKYIILNMRHTELKITSNKRTELVRMQTWQLQEKEIINLNLTPRHTQASNKSMCDVMSLFSNPSFT